MVLQCFRLRDRKSDSVLNFASNSDSARPETET